MMFVGEGPDEKKPHKMMFVTQPRALHAGIGESPRQDMRELS